MQVISNAFKERFSAFQDQGSNFVFSVTLFLSIKKGATKISNGTN